jgi:hypothetical protein
MHLGFTFMPGSHMHNAIHLVNQSAGMIPARSQVNEMIENQNYAPIFTVLAEAKSLDVDLLEYCKEERRELGEWLERARKCQQEVAELWTDCGWNKAA